MLHYPMLTCLLFVFLLAIQGEARATCKTEQRGGGDTETAGETDGD